MDQKNEQPTPTGRPPVSDSLIDAIKATLKLLDEHEKRGGKPIPLPGLTTPTPSLPECAEWLFQNVEISSPLFSPKEDGLDGLGALHDQAEAVVRALSCALSQAERATGQISARIQIRIAGGPEALRTPEHVTVEHPE